MSTAGWLFMVGLRVVDLVALLAWLVWFFRRQENRDDEPPEDEGRGGGGSGPSPEPPVSPGPGGDVLLPDSDAWPVRLRDHTASRPRRRFARRAPRRREKLPS